MFKVINKKNIPLKGGFKRLSGLYAVLRRELENSWFRFLMSQTGYFSPKLFCIHMIKSEFSKVDMYLTFLLAAATC